MELWELLGHWVEANRKDGNIFEAVEVIKTPSTKLVTGSHRIAWRSHHLPMVNIWADHVRLVSSNVEISAADPKLLEKIEDNFKLVEGLIIKVIKKAKEKLDADNKV